MLISLFREDGGKPRVSEADVYKRAEGQGGIRSATCAANRMRSLPDFHWCHGKAPR